MAKKIYPNDKCPCGSGKKYKNCCGKETPLNLPDPVRSDMPMEDFVKERLYEDLQFLNYVLNVFFSNENMGYSYYLEHREEIEAKFKEGNLWSLVERDDLEIYRTCILQLNSEDFFDSKSVKNVYPYGGGAPKIQEDIVSLCKKNLIKKNGRQVELFHAYLMFNLNKRFDDYFYLPGEKWTKDRYYGPTARRGYDFLLAMTLYLEMQLGVHVYLNNLDLKEWKQTYGKDVVNYFEIQNYKIPDGFLFFFYSYMEVLKKINSRFSNSRELQLYHKYKAFDDKVYNQMLSMLNKGNNLRTTECDYIKYLRCLVPSICLNDGRSYINASVAFPQCDVIKYVEGLKDIITLFEEKTDGMDINPCEEMDQEMIDHMEDYGYDMSEYHISKQDLYHDAVFYMADEINGTDMSKRSTRLEYDDFPEINAAQFDKNGRAVYNPARKIFRRNEIQVRKLRIEIYQILNGRMFDLYDTGKGKSIGRYPVFPWISRGDEKTLHVKLPDPKRTYEDLFSEDVEVRQQTLGMEQRLTEIPVNCIEEYLNPDIYYTWIKEQDLMKEVEAKNVTLVEIDARRQKQLDLNQELIRNVSHSSANYLNPDKLAETGMELQSADAVNLGVEKLRVEGNSLLLQSEQETYLSRQLNSLVWRCSANLDLLAQQIRDGVTKGEGVDVTEAVGFAMKSLLARIIFRDQDKRSNFICNKLKKTEDEWADTRKSFIQEILLIRQIKWEIIFDWWNRYIVKLNFSMSERWSEIRIVPERAFYDLIIEIITELLLNALSHGDAKSEIKVEFGEAEMFRGRPNWVYVLCENTVGDEYPGGQETGIKTLNETMLLLNNSDRGVDKKLTDDKWCTKVWLMALYLKALI